jgi:hypothetical protein
MQVKKGKIIAVATVLLAAFLATAVAIPQFNALAWAKDSCFSCELVFGQIRNDHGEHVARPYEGFIKLDGNIVASIDGTVNWDEWARIEWTPPAGTSGSVQVFVKITNDAGHTLDSLCKTKHLNCLPDYQLNLSHIECVEEGEGENLVEVHFVLLNVPDGITPDTLTYTYGTIEPGAHTGNVWHYTDYLPDGYYNIASASVEVNGVTVSLHNPGDYAGNYDCSEDESTSAYVEIGSCRWKKEESITSVSIIVNEGARLFLNGIEYTSSTTVYLLPGHNSWYAEALEGYILTGETGGEFDTYSCRPSEAYAYFDVGVCDNNKREVYVTIVGKLTAYIFDPASDTPNEPAYELTNSTTLLLPPNTYKYLLVADEGYELVGEEEGKFVVGPCGSERPEKPTCPTCGPHIDEFISGGVSKMFTSSTACEIFWNDEEGRWCNSMTPYAIILSDVPISILDHKTLTFTSVEATLYQGEDYYVVEGNNLPNQLGRDWSIWYGTLDEVWNPANYAAGEYQRAWEIVGTRNVRTFYPCGRQPGPWDVVNGVAHYKIGHNVSEWADYIRSSFGWSWEDASSWASQLQLSIEA